MNNQFVFDCNKCNDRCDGISKGTYIFSNDVDYSENKENLIIRQINQLAEYTAKKCELNGYPDIEVFSKKTKKTFYIEIKAQRRTFMSIKKILPESGLEPSETLALNLSDLLRYFQIFHETKSRIFIVWCLENRPCIVEKGKTKYYYQDINTLEKIYNKELGKRRFRRKSGYGDVVNGEHKGVVVNYHFSLKEFCETHLKELLKKGENND